MFYTISKKDDILKHSFLSRISINLMSSYLNKVDKQKSAFFIINPISYVVPSLRVIKDTEKKQKYLGEACAYNRWEVFEKVNFFGEKEQANGRASIWCSC